MKPLVNGSIHMGYTQFTWDALYAPDKITMNRPNDNEYCDPDLYDTSIQSYQEITMLINFKLKLHLAYLYLFIFRGENSTGYPGCRRRCFYHTET